jgi:hypothetical protein
MSDRKDVRTRRLVGGGIGLIDDSGDLECVRSVRTPDDPSVTAVGT